MNTPVPRQLKRDVASEALPSPDPHELASWQRLVLPIMAFAVLAAGVFFAVVIIQEIRTLYSKLEQEPVSIAKHFESFERARPDAISEISFLRFKTLALLEAEALQRRYHQANASTLSRVWTRQMGFLTGMLMALIGSAFILGRLEVRQATLSAEGVAPNTAAGALKAALATTSPGIVLATLGTILMAITIAIPGQVSTTDAPVYLRSQALMEATQGVPDPLGTLPNPPALPEPPPLSEGVTTPEAKSR